MIALIAVLRNAANISSLIACSELWMISSVIGSRLSSPTALLLGRARFEMTMFRKSSTASSFPGWTTTVVPFVSMIAGPSNLIPGSSSSPS